MAGTLQCIEKFGYRHNMTSICRKIMRLLPQVVLCFSFQSDKFIRHSNEVLYIGGLRVSSWFWNSHRYLGYGAR